MNIPLWSVVRTLACFAFTLAVIWFCFMLSSLGEYLILGWVVLFALTLLVGANLLFDFFMMAEGEL